MWFRKKNKKTSQEEELNQEMDLFYNSDVINIENFIASTLNQDLYCENIDVLKKITNKEIKISKLSHTQLLFYYSDYRDELVKFGILLFKEERKIQEQDEKEMATIVSRCGLGKGFSIKYTIYYHFLCNNKFDELAEYLKERRIPKFRLFRDRLVKYYNMIK